MTVAAESPELAPTRLHDDAESPNLVAIWLLVVAALVFAMVVVGGATRLTGSGLSITQWKPVSGAIPPLTEAAWRHLFRLYRATPQFRIENPAMSLGQFRFIFWWEWSHRLLGRLVGFVFGVPFLALLATRKLPRALVWPCAGLLALGALQGLVGWLMVETGLEGRTAVAPEALAIHLGLALFLFVALVWTALSAWRGSTAASSSTPAWRWASGLMLLGVYLQCLLGALVAGSHGGFVDNDWPLMGGRLVPADYWRGGLVATVFEGPAASQFDHRLGAYLLLAGAIALAIAAGRAATGGLRGLALALCGAILVEASLGVATVRLVDPLALAIVHQAFAVIVLAAATLFAWRSRHPPVS